MDNIEQIDIERITSNSRDKATDTVAAEIPLTIILNNNELVTILCSPSKMDFLAIGYLASEGLLDARYEIKNINVNEQRGTVRVDTIKDSGNVDRMVFKRVLTTGCGRGASLYSFADMKQQIKVESGVKTTASRIFELVKDFQQRSEIFKVTGGVHSAALCNKNGILLFAEDIGRHNAIDKIFGECMMNDIAFDDTMIMTSGRVASEILLKTAKRNIGILISHSAPTALAVRLARQTNITLIGFARGQRMNIYTNGWRVISYDSPE